MSDDGRKHAYCSGAARWSARDLSCLDTTGDCWAARSRRGAGSTLTGELKEHRSQQRGKLFACRLQTKPRTNRPEFSLKERTDGVPECASAVFLEENGALFTLTP